MNRIIRVVGGVFYKRHPEVQVQLFRKVSGSIAGYFEFPGGKIESNETAESALKREILEELGVSIVVQDLVGSNTFEVTGRSIELTLYLIELEGPAEFVFSDHDAVLWLNENESTSPPIAPGDVPLLPQIFSLIKTKI